MAEAYPVNEFSRFIDVVRMVMFRLPSLYSSERARILYDSLHLSTMKPVNENSDPVAEGGEGSPTFSLILRSKAPIGFQDKIQNSHRANPNLELFTTPPYNFLEYPTHALPSYTVIHEKLKESFSSFHRSPGIETLPINKGVRERETCLEVQPHGLCSRCDDCPQRDCGFNWMQRNDSIISNGDRIRKARGLSGHVSPRRMPPKQLPSTVNRHRGQIRGSRGGVGIGCITGWCCTFCPSV